jgi:enoyl-CoA hydratase
MDYRHIVYRVDEGGIARVILNRPEVRNAQSRRLLEEMDDAFQQAVKDDAVRVIILSGNGPSFSAGHDLGSKEQKADAEQRPPKPGLPGRYERMWEQFIEFGFRWRNLPKPTIAMVQGYCIFGGWMIATAMDLIVAADDAKFLASHFQYFSVPYDVGIRKAKELLFEFRFLGPEEAERAGFVNLVVPRAELEERTLALARRIAESDPFWLRLVKLSLNQAQDHMGYSTFITGALQTYAVLQESNVKPATEQPGGGRRRFAVVDRALQREHERADVQSPRAAAATSDD